MDDLTEIRNRVQELEAQVQMLMMAVQSEGPSPGLHHLGRVMVGIGLNAQELRGYYRFLGEVPNLAVDSVLLAFLRHLPHRRPEHLLEIGIAHYLDTASPASKLFMEAALRRLRELESDSPGGAGSE